MSEPTRLSTPGSGVNAAIGARALASATTAIAARLRIGMQVELQPARSIKPDLIEARLRPLEDSSAWTPSVRVQLTTHLSTRGLQTSSGERSAPGTPPPTLRAEVVATSPTLVLRLVSPADRSTPLPSPAVAAGAREWLGQQFRQHWPEARPVAATLDRIATRLAVEIGADPIAIPKTVTTTTTPPTSVPSDADTASPIQIQRAVATLIGQIATIAELTDPERLAVAIGRSGLWLESRLAHAAIDPAQSSELTFDLKAQLLTLAQRIRLQGSTQPIPPSPAQPPLGRRSDSPAPQSPPPSPAQPPLGRRSDSPTAPLPSPVGTEPRLEATAGQTRLPANEVTTPRQLAPQATGGERTGASVDRTEQQPGASAAAPNRVQTDRETTPRSPSPSPSPSSSSPSPTTPATTLNPPPGAPDEPKPERPVEPVNQNADRLARDVEGMIKQVVTKQLQSLDSPAGQTQWLLELPFRTPTGLLALEADIRREQARQDNEADGWNLRLRLDLPRLGALNIRLTLRDERLNASLQAADPEIAERIRSHLGELRARLEAREITVAGLHAGHRPLERPAPPFEAPLVREQA